MATNLYKKREPAAGHRLTFVCPSAPKGKTAKIMDAVFEFQQGVYDSDRFKDINITFENNEFDNKEKIWALFYNKYYCDNPIYFAPEMDKSSEISADSFYKAITSVPNMPLNSIFFLLGKIGCGKTTFINNILAKKAKEWFDNNNILFVRVSAYNVPIGEQYSYDNLLDKLIVKIQYILSHDEVKVKLCKTVDNFEKKLENFRLNSQYKSNISEKEDALKEFLSSIRDAGFRVLFVIDNLDYIFHIDDEILFTSELHDRSKAFENAIQFITLFEDKAKLARLKMNVLITLRPDTYKYLTDRYLKENLAAIPHVAYDRHCYFVDTPNITTVVQNRLLMAAKLAEYVLPSKEVDMDKISEPLNVFFEPTETTIVKGKSIKDKLMEFLVGISLYGLRDIINFCSNYCWIKSTTIEYEQGLDRFTNHFYAGSVAFLINGRARYSQQYSQFPNIYSPAQFSDLNPTYLWLKRLILQYIYHYESINPKATITPEAIFNCFVAKEKGYPDILVRETLNELTKLDSSYLTTVELRPYDGKCDLHKVFLTSRGWTCLTRNIFETFMYLQLVIDDFDLPILKEQSIWSRFAYPNEDYRYLIAAKSDYHKFLPPFLSQKAEQVLLLLQVLKYSLKFEQAQFPQVFENLKEEGISLINIDDIRTNNINQMAVVLTYINFHSQFRSGALTKKEYERKFNETKEQIVQIDKRCEDIGKTTICQLYEVTP